MSGCRRRKKPKRQPSLTKPRKRPKPAPNWNLRKLSTSCPPTPTLRLKSTGSATIPQWLASDCAPGQLGRPRARLCRTCAEFQLRRNGVTGSGSRREFPAKRLLPTEFSFSLGRQLLVRLQLFPFELTEMLGHLKCNLAPALHSPSIGI